MITRKMRCMAMVLGGWMWTSGVRAEEQLIVPPPGDYQMIEVVLEKAVNPHYGHAVVGGNFMLRGVIRDGKLKIPSRLSVRDIVCELAVELTPGVETRLRVAPLPGGGKR
jgi:hypothetical protein